jgi:serine protease Do
MDLKLFQFDYDMSFAIFFLNADRTIYGRYGTRSHRPKEAHLDISMTGLAEAMKAATDLHSEYPENRNSLLGKAGAKPRYPSPEKIPVAILFPWPLPEVVGLTLDRAKRATVMSVLKCSPADAAGFNAGDELISLSGQPLVSIADVQWVLHRSGPNTTLPAQIMRNGKPQTLALVLKPGWREKSDISWRTSSWNYRRIASGGMLLENLSAEERKRRGIADGKMALRVEYVGQWGKYATAKRAGFEKDDLIVSFDGHDDAWKEQDLWFYVMEKKKTGDRIPITEVRGNRKLEVKLPVQD